MEAGQLLLHYRLIEKIGAGGMGVVWKAEDTKLHRHVALKVLPESMAADPDRRARFEREARAVAALNHPNIVTLYSVEEAETPAGPVHVITMELVEGQPLTRLLPKGGFPLGQLLELAIPLADAVSCAHRAGITHRDLKPDNIMIDGEGRLRVLDFGLAKHLEPAGTRGDTQAATVTSDTAEGRVLGTAAYMSPEQAEGKEVDARSDVFSLGTILYEMATGSRPFRGNTTMSTIGAILKDEPSSITELKPSLPRHAGRIIRRCHAKDPNRRYQSALDLRNELEGLRNEIRSGMHDADPTRTPARSRVPLSWIVGGVGLVLGLLFVALWQNWPRRSDPVFTSRRLTTATAWETSMTWSPEGEFIAFGQVREGSMDVMVQPVAGGEAQLRAGGPGDETTPRWSPDGRWLAYVSTTEPGTWVHLVPPHGGTPRKLIDTGISTLDINNVFGAMGAHPWSRNSQTLLVSRADDSGQLAIYRVDRDNRSAEQLSFPPAGSDDVEATYSPDGERIGFVRLSYGRGVLMRMPVAGGEPEVLLEDEFDNREPVFRPDGRHLIYRSNRPAVASADWSVWQLDLESGSLRRLVDETHEIWSTSVSSTDRVAFNPMWHDTFLFVVDRMTGERRQLTTHAADNFGARFSPDGKTIAYQSTRTGDAEVFLHHVDGTPETRVTDDPGWDLYPDWSPDERQLIFASSRQDGRFKLFIVNSDGGGERLLVDQPITVSNQLNPVNARLVSRWSPRGRRVAYTVTTDDGTSLWTVRPDGEDTREVIRDVEWFDWHLDAEHAIYARRHGTDHELVAVDLQTGKQRTLWIGPVWEMDVAPDGRAVAFCTGRGHFSMGLAVLELEPSAEPGGLPRAVGEPEYVVRTDGTWHVHNGGWSPDSKSIVYTRDQDYGSIYELVESR